jgi:phosphocarrier protein
MPERRATVGTEIGLHARPASLFVQEAAKQPVTVTIRKEPKDGEEALPAVDARSILSVLAMDARGGNVVVLSAEGEGADEALEALAAFVEKDWDAEEKSE